MPHPITRRYVVVGVFAIGSDGHAVEPAYRLRTINIHSPVNKDWLAKTLTWAAYNNHEVRIRPA